MPGAACEHPTKRTGTAEDLMAIVLLSDEERRIREGTRLPAKGKVQRLLLQTPFNCFGIFLSLIVDSLPAEWALKWHDWLYRRVGGPRSYVFDQNSGALRDSRELVLRAGREAGAAPALLGLISHPPVLGDLSHLNFELVRHATHALRALRGAACRPRLVAAVDPFALDSVSMPVEGAYAGYMGWAHIGLDRLTMARGAVSAWLLRRTGWFRMPFRMTRLLGAGGEVGMVLSGGVPSTTRALYVAREWLAGARAKSDFRGRPGEVLRRLDLDLKSAGTRSVWRAMEFQLTAALSGGGSRLPASDSGKITPELEGAARACLDALGLPETEKSAALKDLGAELSRETPYRARFFNLLARRVFKKGRPLIFLPIVHRTEGGLGIEIKPAWAWVGFSRGRLRALIAGASAPWEGTVGEFARKFVGENFL